MKKGRLVGLAISVLCCMLSFWGCIMIRQAGIQKTYTLYNSSQTQTITIRGILADGVSLDLALFAEDGTYEEAGHLLTVPAHHTVSFTVGSSAFMRIYFTKIGAGSVVKLADQQENIMRVNLSELKNESGDFMLLFNESRVDLLHSFLAGLDIWKCLFCLGLIAALFLFDFFAVKHIWSFLEQVTKSYRLLELLKAGVLFFLLLLGTIYPVLDLLPTAAVFAGFGILLALLLFQIREGVPIQNAYAVLALYLGISMLFLLPMFRVPDEFCHFTNIYAKSFLPKEMHGGAKGEELVLFDQDLEETFISFQGGYGGDFLDGKCNARKFYHDMALRVNSGRAGTIYNWYANCANLSVVPYIPAILATAVLRHLSIPPIVLLLAVRLVNFLISLLLGYLSIKWIPIWKKYVFIVLMLPVYFQQAFGMNQDSLNNALFILSFSMLVSSASKNIPITMREIIQIMGVLISLSCCKLGYAPIALFILLIPNERFGKRAKSVLWKIGMFACILGINIAYVIHMMPSEAVTSWYNRNSVNDVLADPFGTMLIYIRTFAARFEGDFFTGLLSGMGIGFWTVAGIAQVVSLAVLILLLFVSGREESYNGKPQLYLVSFMSFALMCGLIYTSLWCGWTVKGAKQVEGLQPRYFLPPALLLYISCANPFVQSRMDQKKERWILYSGMGFIGWVSLLAVLGNAYV